MGTTPIGNDKSVDLLASVKRRLLFVRLFIFLYANPYAKRGTVVLVGVPNSPFFGPRGEIQGFEDYLVIDFRLRNLQFHVVAAPTLIAYGFTHHKKYNLRYACDTLHTWVMVLKVGLEPTHTKVLVPKTSASSNSAIQAYKRTWELQSSPAASPTIDLDFGRIFLDITLRHKTLFLVLFYLR